MTRRRNAISLLVVLVSALLVSPGFARAGEPPRSRPATPDADSLYRRALHHLERGTRDHRRLALRDLEQAARMGRDRADVLHGVARVYSAMGYLERARGCLDRIAKVTTDDAEAQIQLGLLWKSEWLASLEFSSYQKAIRCLLRGAQLAPGRLEPRVALTALALAKGDTSLATRAAQSAVLCDRTAVEAALALACAAYRTGRLARADSAFRAVLPRLPDELRARFTDLSAVAWDASPRPGAREPVVAEEPFWAGSDPDLTTPENEVQLDFRARVAHAALLFSDPHGSHWDVRAELLARYGVPPKVELPPPPDADEDADPSSPVFTYLAFVFSRNAPLAYAPPPMPYPYHKQTWVYPELGIRAELWDRSLDQSYVLPVATHRESDPRPDPALLAGRADLVVLGDGRGVYRAVAPGVTLMPVRGAIARFPSDRGARLVAHLEAPAEDTRPLHGSWVVVDAEGRELARASGALSLSACRPGERRIVQFDAEVPPGDYRLHLAVDDARGQRGIVRLQARVEPVSPGFAMSDLVLLCGAPVGAGRDGPVLIEPNFEPGLQNARTVSVYFEAYHLAVDGLGRSRFSYRYVLREAGERDVRRNRPRAALLETTREEENIGPHRRQVVSAPVATLAPGTYDFEVEVRDLVSGAVATRSVRFVKG